MNLLNKLLKRKDAGGETSSPENLPQFCYGMAYFFLPPFFFNDAQRVIGYFANETVPAGAFLYAMACKARQVEPSRDGAVSFSAHSGTLGNGVSYYVVEYPEPRPLQMERMGKDDFVLAPFFSAMLYDEATSQCQCYVLGQRPFGGTTLRQITPDGNYNLGEGPEPTLLALVAVLETVVSREAVAGVVYNEQKAEG